MAIRHIKFSEKWRPIRAFAVVALVAGATSLGATAWANDCAAVDIVVARGTGEPGWLGSVVGDPLYGELAQALPVDSTANAVIYPADLRVASSAADGTADMVDHLVRQSADCPDQRFVLVGYSQGAAVVHGVLGTALVAGIPGVHTLPVYAESKVAAVLLFGDPLRALGWDVPDLYRWRTGNYCAGGDPICGAGIDMRAHTDYGWAIRPAAWFAVAHL
ncbi:cutinase family protein [Nocardia sp. NPDC005366]|uniref:cutinase family protein n=1 Tax=Nocardia sp. NPDC005366 TaxID=3156878 RepID=UPI0033B7031C